MLTIQMEKQNGDRLVVPLPLLLAGLWLITTCTTVEKLPYVDFSGIELGDLVLRQYSANGLSIPENLKRVT